MAEFYQRFCKETFDENGKLTRFDPIVPPHFNFGYDVVDEIARTEPNRRAMLWTNEQGEERTFTFAEMKKYSDAAAGVLRAHGVGKGDMVMLVVGRHYQFWFSILACHKLGAVAIPGTHLLTKKDFVYRFNAADVKAILCLAEGETAAQVDLALPESPTVTAKLIVAGQREGWSDFDAELESCPPLSERVMNEPEDPMLMYFTSGTTGYPKMVMHSFTYPIGHIITARHWQRVDPEGLHLTVADTGWGKAVWGKLYGQWFMRAGVFVHDFGKFDPEELLGVLEKYRITTFCAPPTIFRFFIKAGMERFDLSALQHVTIAGEALNPEVFQQFKNLTGLPMMEGFGQTETTLTVCNLEGMVPKPGSMGKPSPQFDVSIVDEEGNPCPPGQTGEIVLRKRPGQCGLFSEYYRAPEITRAAWEGGVYHTGDTAWQDEEGYFWYVGRTDDLIKSSGYRIGPFEIESVLMEHPSVLECAVTGVPDPVRGQLVKATIVLAKGYEASDTLKKDIQNYVKKNTAPYKYPRVIDFVDELPKTISGKIRRVDLRADKSTQSR